MIKTPLKSALILAFFISFSNLFAQVTTSAVSGLVTDDSGELLIGATVTATHTPTGTFYGVITQDNGRFVIPNMRIGGPYRIEVSYVGYEASIEENVFLSLGQKEVLNFSLGQTSIMAEEVVITAISDPILNNERTGAETSINSTMLATLPTISRSAEDYTRLNPMAAGGSFAGRNDQFNNYSLNGAIFNNPFGLDAATPGGQSDAQPISLDAIDQINVAIAPFDVTQSGFTGASIDAVTKSGTNNLSGTIYGFLNNSSLTGGKIDGDDIFKGDPSNFQGGLSIGGPIVKDKAFFFANIEFQNRSDLGSFFVPSGGSEQGNASRVAEADMQLVSSLLNQRYGYDTGLAQGYTHDANNVKGIIRLDFNLGQKHKLAASYNFLDAFRDNPAHPSALGRRGPDFVTLQFQNSGYRINNELQQFNVELNSFLNATTANKFSVGYTSFNDFRDPFSSPFPVVNVGKDGVRYIIAGHEPFSINNRLTQDVFQIRNDLNIYAGKHNWTFGAAYESFAFDNSFNLGVYGGSAFAPDIDINNFADFVNGGGLDDAVAAAESVFSANNANDTWALAETNLAQFSLYVQDEIQMSDKFALTLGLRMDMPLYLNTPDKIQENIDRNCCYDPSIEYFDEDGNSVFFDHTDLPTQSPLINPRIGFNYDINGDRSAQLRGGTGLFSGRFPMVWIGNQVANPNFFFYNMTDPDFRFPQVWRTNIGYDRKVGKGWTFSTDILYTDDLQAQMVRNFGLRRPTGRLEGVDSRPVYQLSDRATVFGGATNAYVFTNIDGGYSFNWSAEIEKAWESAYAKFGYNYTQAEDAMSIDAEISSDAYDRNPANVQNTNEVQIAPSLYGNRHKIFGTLSKKWSYGNGFGTTISLYFEYIEGNRYSYTYSGDINNDGSFLNDLLYIPTDSEIDQMNFGGDAGAQRNAFKAYIAQDEYLSARRGEYAEKYGSLSPWYNTWDIRILQDISIKGSNNKFQLSFDILNAGNLVNSGWGVRQFATNTSLVQPLGVSVADGVPTYSFDTNLRNTFFNDFSTNSRWRIQTGLRYIFGD